MHVLLQQQLVLLRMSEIWCLTVQNLQQTYAELFTDNTESNTMRAFCARQDQMRVFHFVVDCLDFMGEYMHLSFLPFFGTLVGWQKLVDSIFFFFRIVNPIFSHFEIIFTAIKTLMKEFSLYGGADNAAMTLTFTRSHLPIELIGRILADADLDTRVVCHQVCHEWNRVLRQPTMSSMWQDVKFIQAAEGLATYRRQKHQRNFMFWLAHWASGAHYTGACQRFLDTKLR